MKSETLHLTTGQAATMAGLSRKTILNLLDKGELKGFRIPGSRHRRISRAEMRRFLNSSGIPVSVLDAWEEETGLVKFVNEAANRPPGPGAA